MSFLRSLHGRKEDSLAYRSLHSESGVEDSRREVCAEKLARGRLRAERLAKKHALETLAQTSLLAESHLCKEASKETRADLLAPGLPSFSGCPDKGPEDSPSVDEANHCDLSPKSGGFIYKSSSLSSRIWLPLRRSRFWSHMLCPPPSRYRLRVEAQHSSRHIGSCLSAFLKIGVGVR